MKTIISLCMALLVTTSISNEKLLAEAKKTAEAFIRLVDVNDGNGLTEILHPEMVQFAKIGDQLMPMKGTDFVQMVTDKKLGGTPREIKMKDVKLVRGETADIVLQAVSDEYDFMYQISMVKEGGKWLIVSVMSDIQPVK